MNAGAFNLGAGLSFAVLFAVTTASDYQLGIVTGAVIVACALGTSLLIPKPETISDTLAAVTATETAQGRSL